MTPTNTRVPDLSLDLLLERVVDVPREFIWRAWTTPELLKRWFTPAPWKTVECEIDVKPGGVFRTVMQSPEGKDYPNEGCVLEVVENRKLVWTSAMLRGYRPQSMGSDELLFTAVIILEDCEGGSRYTAVAIHPDSDSRKRHEEMGFHSGWGAAFDQLVALVKR